jgi:hypothetical protein
MSTTNNTDKKSNNGLTTVKTVYARAAVLLLALNFCLTGYVVINLNNTVQGQMDAVVQSSNEETTSLNRGTPSEVQSNPVETLDRTTSSGPEGQ